MNKIESKDSKPVRRAPAERKMNKLKSSPDKVKNNSSFNKSFSKDSVVAKPKVSPPKKSKEAQKIENIENVHISIIE